MKILTLLILILSISSCIPRTGVSQDNDIKLDDELLTLNFGLAWFYNHGLMNAGENNEFEFPVFIEFKQNWHWVKEFYVFANVHWESTSVWVLVEGRMEKRGKIDDRFPEMKVRFPEMKVRFYPLNKVMAEKLFSDAKGSFLAAKEIEGTLRPPEFLSGGGSIEVKANFGEGAELLEGWILSLNDSPEPIQNLYRVFTNAKAESEREYKK